ncbi:MAG: FecR domain-containing protein [Caldilineaceae bacterium]|nr:FecR domain-containing protein [Caldilineaceae bacterium]
MQSNISIVVWAITLGIVAILIASIGWQLRSATGTVDTKASATINGGTALYASAEGGVQEVAAGAALLLSVGDTITATTASIQITYFDGQTTELLPGASITIQQLENREGRTVVEILVNIGRVFNRIKRSLRDGEMFRVNTPSSAAAVRGTEFIVETQNATTSYYATMEGVVRVTMGNEHIDLRAGEEVLAVQGQPLTVQPQSQTQTNATNGFVTSVPLEPNSTALFDAAASNLAEIDSDEFASESKALSTGPQGLSPSPASDTASALSNSTLTQEHAVDSSFDATLSNALSVEPATKTDTGLGSSTLEDALLRGASAEPEDVIDQQLATLRASIVQQVIVAQQTAFAQKTAAAQAVAITPQPTSVPLTAGALTKPAAAQPVVSTPTMQPTAIASPRGAAATQTPARLPSSTSTPTIAPTATAQPTAKSNRPSRPTKTATQSPTQVSSATWTPQSLATVEPTLTPDPIMTTTASVTAGATPSATPTDAPSSANTAQPTADPTAQTTILPTSTSFLSVDEIPGAIGTLAAEPTAPLMVTPIPTVGFAQTATSASTSLPAPIGTATPNPTAPTMVTPTPTATSVQVIPPIVSSTPEPTATLAAAPTTLPMVTPAPTLDSIPTDSIPTSTLLASPSPASTATAGPTPIATFVENPTPTLIVVQTETPVASPVPTSMTTPTFAPTATSVETPLPSPIIVTPTASSVIIAPTDAETSTPVVMDTPTVFPPTATDNPTTPTAGTTRPAHPTHPPTPEQRATPKP